MLLSITDMLGSAIEEVEFIVLGNNPIHIGRYTKPDSKFRFRPLHSRRQFLEVIKVFRGADAFILGGDVPVYDEMPHMIAMYTFELLKSLGATEDR